MNWRNISLMTIVLVVIAITPMDAQEKLGDLVSQHGYEWIIGKWAATTDEGDKTEVEYKWGLDRWIVLVDVKTQEGKYHGMIMFRPSSEEVIQIGADNKGGTWKGTWQDEYGDAVLRTEHTTREGDVRKNDFVHSRIDLNTFKVTSYGVESDGSRSASPWYELTYKRQKRPRISTTLKAVEKTK
jgi:hypothetical protein